MRDSNLHWQDIMTREYGSTLYSRVITESKSLLHRLYACAGDVLAADDVGLEHVALARWLERAQLEERECEKAYWLLTLAEWYYSEE